MGEPPLTQGILTNFATRNKYHQQKYFVWLPFPDS